MTITVADFGSLNRTNDSNPSAVSSRTFTPGVAASQWDLLVVYIAADNAGTSGADSVSGVSDSKGLTWSFRQGATKQFSSPNTGVTSKVYTAEVGSSGFSVSDTITVSFSPDTIRCAVLAWKCIAATNKYYTIIGGDSTTSPGPPGYITGFNVDNEWDLGSITSGDAVFCGLGAERKTEPTGVESDTTNGSWVPSGTSRNAEDSGTSAVESDCIMMSSNYKITTGTGSQAWRCNHSATVDWAGVHIVVRENAASTPDAPNAPTVTPNAVGGFNLDWNDVGTPAGGRPVTDYKYKYSTDNSNWSAPVLVGSATSTVNVTGLDDGQLYYFQIAAVNAVGTGSYSSSGSATSWDVPDQVTTLSATNDFDDTFGLSWTAPDNNGSTITDYVVEWAYKGSGSWNTWSHSALGAVSSCDVTGLQKIYSYDFRIKAINAVGTAASYSNTGTAEGKARATWGIDMSNRAHL